MSRSSSAALVAALAVTVTSLARAQQPAADTTAHRARPSATSDQRQDRRTIAVDSTRLTHDIALRDSARARLVSVRDRLPADEARIDSLKAQVARDRKANPPDVAAERRDMAALKQARSIYDQDLDRFKRDRSEVATLEKRVDGQADAETAARKDLRADRTGAPKADSAQKARQAVRRDERQDAHVIATDSTRLHHDIAIRDSARTMLAQDQARTRTDEAKLDSLQAALIRARKNAPADTAAIKTSIAQAKKTLESDKDRDQHQRSALASADRKVSKEADATADARHDLRTDRSSLEHPAVERATAKSHRR
jgi:hypothetical protein